MQPADGGGTYSVACRVQMLCYGRMALLAFDRTSLKHNGEAFPLLLSRENTCIQPREATGRQAVGSYDIHVHFTRTAFQLVFALLHFKSIV